METRTTEEIWEERYRQARVWSGRPNHALVTHASDLTPGRTLDLGCGEGADTIWLAQRGWQATGVDVSATALERAESHARKRGVRARWVHADLAEWHTEETFDLVTAFFLHSPVNFPRARILRKAAGAVSGGGVLLVVGHAGFPPWSSQHTADRDRPTFPSVQEAIAEAGLGREWEIEVAEDSPREVTGPQGQRATIHDAVLKARRR